jgi:hypothetical protein
MIDLQFSGLRSIHTSISGESSRYIIVTQCVSDVGFSLPP